MLFHLDRLVIFRADDGRTVFDERFLQHFSPVTMAFCGSCMCFGNSVGKIAVYSGDESYGEEELLAKKLQ